MIVLRTRLLEISTKYKILKKNIEFCLVFNLEQISDKWLQRGSNPQPLSF